MPDPTNQDMILGELRGQMRELVHTANNLGAKLDGLTREVIGLGPIATELADLKARVVVLEAEKNRHEGATGVVGTILKSPAIGWLVGAAISAWALITGKVHI